ncbi:MULTISPECIES: cytochrome c oxidase subunit II [Bhargavaea]|uniref:Cytochrome aa3 subunit 2 n=1 Tax=Bhargavaea changchunensis TaxID=2134037 RepID=A0ABW2NBZ6_9BACL|nr:cytochrome c oxidase subunit II [Bhargavaea sp. CC-171006]
MHLHKFEKIWLIFGIAMLAVFLGIVGVQAFTQGQTPAGGLEKIDPEKVDVTAPFDDPGVHQIDDDTYEVVIKAMAYGYEPSEIKVPAGKEIIFKLTSKDVIHSFTIPNTKVNMMVVPGQINEKRYTFKEPGTFLILCNEYCGTGHHFMHTEIEVIEQ